MIAAKCPIISGSNVFTARTLLSRMDGAQYDDNEICGESQAGGERKQYTGGTISLYPNPTDDAMILNVAAVYLNREVTLWDMQGRLVKTLSLQSNQEQLTISTVRLAEAAYVLQVPDKDGNRITHKFVVKH